MRRRFYLLVAGGALALTLATLMALRRSQQLTAPSLKVILISCTNASGVSSQTNQFQLFGPLSSLSSQPVAARVRNASYRVLNQGNRPVRVQNGVVIEQRHRNLMDISGNLVPQRLLVGTTGVLQPGESQTFVVQFSLNARHSAFEGEAEANWEFRGVCKTTPTERNLGLLIWVREQSWSKYLPPGLLGKNPSSYVFSSGWTQE